MILVVLIPLWLLGLVVILRDLDRERSAREQAQGPELSAGLEPPRIRKMLATEDGGMKLCFAPGPLLQRFVAEMVEYLRQHNDAPNYVECELVSQEDASRWILLVQKAGGLTPGCKAAMAEERAAQLQTRLYELEKELAKRPQRPSSAAPTGSAGTNG
jgi:hypothetical protein